MAVVVPCASLPKRLLLVSPSGFGKACVASTWNATHRMTSYTIRSPLSLKPVPSHEKGGEKQSLYVNETLTNWASVVLGWVTSWEVPMLLIPVGFHFEPTPTCLGIKALKKKKKNFRCFSVYSSSSIYYELFYFYFQSSLAKFSLAATKPSKISAVQNGTSILAKSRKCIILDIEGTTTPISFVFEVLFPYARDNVRKHLIATYDTDETKDDIKLLRAQVEDDLKQGLNGAVPIPPDETGKDSVIDALVTNVEAMIKADRKITSLKQLQGHIWRTGFEGKEIQGVVFDDVPEALKRWHASGIKVYIYSSGSREAQRLIFGNTTYGDLRPYLCGFFDTMIGNKRELKSYYEITQSVGVDKPSEVLFITDVYPEAVAAKSAGLDVLISLRPGNAPLPEGHGFPTITSFAEV